jgi:hypothetical protein
MRSAELGVGIDVGIDVGVDVGVGVGVGVGIDVGVDVGVGVAFVVTLSVLDVPVLPPPMTTSRNWYAVFGDNPVTVVFEAFAAIEPVTDGPQVKPPSDDL